MRCLCAVMSWGHGLAYRCTRTADQQMHWFEEETKSVILGVVIYKRTYWRHVLPSNLHDQFFIYKTWDASHKLTIAQRNIVLPSRQHIIIFISLTSKLSPNAHSVLSSTYNEMRDFRPLNASGAMSEIWFLLMSLQREGRVKKNICKQEFDENIITVFYWKNALDAKQN